GPKFEFCRILNEWDESGNRTAQAVSDRCPYAEESWHQQNIYCPYSFWGLKHIVEQPLSQLARMHGKWAPADAPDTFAGPIKIDLATAITRDSELDSTKITAHLAELQRLSRIQFNPLTPAEDLNGALDALKSPDIVYFLCHG